MSEYFFQANITESMTAIILLRPLKSASENKVLSTAQAKSKIQAEMDAPMSVEISFKNIKLSHT